MLKVLQCLSLFQFKKRSGAMIIMFPEKFK